MIHRLKIAPQYFAHISEGKKSFEVRINDRDFQAYDLIEFLVLADKDYDHLNLSNDFYYRITYIHSGLGMENRYVILGLEKSVEITR